MTHTPRAPGRRPRSTAPTAVSFRAALLQRSSPTERAAIQKRLAPGDQTHGIRMRDLFEMASSARTMALEEVELLFADPLYEVRMGAVCLLDLRAKDPSTGAAERRRLHDLYLEHHDRITTWDMVDRSAPSVVGGHLLGRSKRRVHELAASSDPLRRRTAMTAPLWFVRHGDDDDLAETFLLAARLVTDPDPLVHVPVGTALKHAGARDPGAVAAFLDRHAGEAPRAVVRAATSKLPSVDRARWGL